MILHGDYESKDVVSLVKEMCEFIVSFEGDIPGATPVECGNYSDQNLTMAKYWANMAIRHGQIISSTINMTIDGHILFFLIFLNRFSFELLI